MVSYVINGSILEIRGEGEYGTGEITRVLIAAKHDPRRSTPTYLLIDIRESESSPSIADMQARVAVVQQQLGESMAPAIAFVARGVGRERLANIYQARAREGGKGFRIEVFSDPETARTWLTGQGAA
jgi:pyridoxal biosynthesis lyase PdxS